MKIYDHNYTDAYGKELSPWKKRLSTQMIILHCTATPEGKDYTVDTINKWHLARGFNGIGYHYIIYRNGEVHRGRSKWAVGAHTTGKNAISISICYVGGMQADMKKAKDTRTIAQKTAMRELVRTLQAIYPGATVHGHYEFAAKACPSFKIKDL